MRGSDKRGGWRQWLALGVLLGGLTMIGFAFREPPDPLQSRRLMTMGTVVDLSTYGVPPDEAREAFDALERRFAGWHHEWHAWAPEAPLARANAAFARGESAELTPDLATLLRHAQHYARASGGLFDPAIGRLLALWGFQQDERPPGPPPAGEAIAELVNRHPEVGAVSLEADGRARSINPAVALDFGGIAKGYAVDLAVAELRARGVTNAIVNAGGNLRAIGDKAGQPWRIGIRNPRGEGVLGWFELAGDAAVSTSGDYERFFDWAGVRYHHILDPRSGYPAIGAAAVTVIADSAEHADAASSALLIAGPSEWLALARELGVEAVLRVDERGAVQMTPAMAARVHFDGAPGWPVEITAAP